MKKKPPRNSAFFAKGKFLSVWGEPMCSPAFVWIYTPISLTAQRNGGITAKETPFQPLRCSRNCCPLHKGTKRSTEQSRFLILTAIVQADGGFLFKKAARLNYRRKRPRPFRFSLPHQGASRSDDGRVETKPPLPKWRVTAFGGGGILF